MDLQAFLMENVPPFEEKELLLSDRLPPFRIRAISEEENARLRAGCRKEAADTIDTDRYLLRLAAACVLFPDLENASLQRSWGVMGADALLRKMLSPGEFARLLEQVQIACGFDVPVRQLADDLKNA